MGSRKILKNKCLTELPKHLFLVEKKTKFKTLPNLCSIFFWEKNIKNMSNQFRGFFVLLICSKTSINGKKWLSILVEINFFQQPKLYSVCKTEISIHSEICCLEHKFGNVTFFTNTRCLRKYTFQQFYNLIALFMHLV